MMAIIPREAPVIFPASYAAFPIKIEHNISSINNLLMNLFFI